MKSLLGLPVIVFLVKDKIISIIGAGSLGTAIIECLVCKGHQNIIATRNNSDELINLKRKYGIQTSIDNQFAANKSDIIILTVKPYLIDKVCNGIFSYSGDKLVLSLAANKSIEDIENILTNSRVGRIMTGINVKDELATYCLGSKCNHIDEKIVHYIFGNESINTTEQGLAERTYLACESGLMPFEIEQKVQRLSALGSDNARLIIGHMFKSVYYQICDGLDGYEICDKVGGAGSFTDKINQEINDQGTYAFKLELMGRIIKSLK